MRIQHSQINKIKQSTYHFGCFIGLVCLLFLAACREQNHSETVPSAENKVKIEIMENGFYQVDLAAIEKAGINFEQFSKDTLVLTTQGQPVPFYFDDDNKLVFYGQAPSSRYSASRPYILEMGENGMTMAVTAVTPSQSSSPNLNTITSSLHLEESLLYESQARVHGEDVWFWETIRQGQSFPISFNLPEVTDGAGEITLQLIGVSYNNEVENDHDFDIVINGVPVGAVQFDGEIVHNTTLDVPPGTFKSGQNEIVLDNSREGATFLDIMQLNWIDVAYNAPPTAVDDNLILEPAEGLVIISGFNEAPLLFDITDPNTPQQITEIDTSKNSFQLPLQPDKRIAAVSPDGMTTPALSPVRESDWRNPSHQADLIILTTDELAPSLAPLVEARAAENLGVQLVPVADIYDEFGGGENSPDSLNKFISYAYEQWQDPKPRYLLLVGDATSDYRNYLGIAPQNSVPAPMVPVSFSGETVSDSMLADTDGDGAPNLAVGRWPVNTPEEAAALVARTLAYEQGTAVNTTFFAADGTEPQFAQMAQSIATNSNLAQESLQISSAPQADEVTKILNDGAWLATYVGHGSLHQWGKDDVFTEEAIINLDSETPPIVIQLTCLTGLFTQPEQTSLTELLLNHESGPVLSVAATSLTLSAHQEPFATNLLQNLNDPTVVRMGDAFQAAKLSLDIEESGLREVSDTFALFGDPSAHIIRPK